VTGGAVWKGITAIKIGVSLWMTTKEDIGICSTAIIRIAKEETGRYKNSDQE
jgi:hypothetical protein